jgi:hypothetical protein
MKAGDLFTAMPSLLATLLWLVALVLWGQPANSLLRAESQATADLVQKLMIASDYLAGIRFAEVVTAATGQQVLPINLQRESDQRILSAIESATRRVLAEVLEPHHSVHDINRINEVSNRLERYLMREIDVQPGIYCGPPLTAEGIVQASGYPDFIILDELTGRVVYLDPKVLRAGSELSSFRSFYYEPKTATNKINLDGSHMILGLEHIGKVNGKWRFKRWQLVDLIDFEVRLKAEFQASNRDLYRSDALLRSDTAPE